MRVAAIDIGSNSVRLLVADIEDGTVKPRKKRLLTTRLGHGIEKRTLHPEAMERTVQAISQFLQKAVEENCDTVLAAATSAVRDARNSTLFIDRVKNELQLPVKILTGRDEALLTYYGVLSGLEERQGQPAVMDLGGGSTELIWQEKGEMKWESIDVGAVRATEGDYSDDKIKRLVMPTLGEMRRAGARTLVGVGGTVTNLASMALRLKVYDPARVHGYRLTITRVRDLLALLQGTVPEERRTITGLQPERGDIMERGTQIVYLIMEGLQVSSLDVSEADILFGIARQAADSVDNNDGIIYH